MDSPAPVGAAPTLTAMSLARRSVPAAALAGYAVLLHLGRQAGSTPAERRRSLPGDAIVRHPHVVTDHAVTIHASREAVWPWLTQMGWHRAGYYTPRWVDRLLFPANGPSLDHLDPDLVHHLEVGDTVPDGPPGTAWFVVVEVDEPSYLVLHSTTHVPLAWRQRYGAAIDWTWTFRLREVAPDQTRLHLRVRGRTSPWWLTLTYLATIVPADLVMAMGMLRGLRRRVERNAGQ